MDIKTELHNLKTMVLTESHISDEAKKNIADRINQIQKGVVMNYIPCCTSEAEQLSVAWKAIEWVGFTRGEEFTDDDIKEMLNA